MPRKAKIRPDEPGRERVLDAGLELFADRGYHATSIAEIGERAGIAKSVLYHYFGSKAGLYEAILEAETQEAVQRVADALPEDRDAPRLQAGINALLGFLSERPAAWRLLLRDPPADPKLVAVHERLAAERVKAVSSLLAKPAKRAKAPTHVGLVTTAIQVFVAWWYEHPKVPREEVTAAIMDVARAAARRIE
jgi:AcrR family transcriptional regulator